VTRQGVFSEGFGDFALFYGRDPRDTKSISVKSWITTLEWERVDMGPAQRAILYEGRHAIVTESRPPGPISQGPGLPPLVVDVYHRIVQMGGDEGRLVTVESAGYDTETLLRIARSMVQ
jgi:hypothetical protein